MKNTDKTKPKQGQGKVKPRIQHAKVEQTEEEREQAEDLLREIEERYRSLFENMLDGFAYCRMLFENDLPQDFIYLNVNEAFEQLTGLKNVIGKKVTEVIPGIRESNPEIFEIYGRVALTGKPERFETYIESLDIWLSISVYSTKKDYFVAAFDNITERKRAEEMLHQRAEELAALQATVLEITTPHDLPNVLQTIVERAAQLLNATSGGLYLCDPERQEVRCVVSYNTSQDYTGTVLKYGEGAAGMVAQSGKPLVIDDYRSWSGRAAAFDEDQPFMAVLSAPTIWQGQVMGVIHVLHGMEGRLFSQDELDLLTLFANHAAVAVENTRLYEHAQKEIAERKQAEEALRASEARFRDLYENAPNAYFSVGVDDRIRRCNRRVGELLGYDVEKLAGRPVVELYADTPYGKEKAAKILQRFRAGETVRDEELQMQRADGTPVWISLTVNAIRDSQGQVMESRSMVVDITERKHLEEQYRTIIRTALDGFWMVDMQGRFLDVNDAYCNLVGYSREELLIMSIPDIEAVEKPEETAARIRKIMKAGGDRFETRHRCKDGRSIDIEVSVNYMKDDERMFVFLRDITERKRAEVTIRQRNEDLLLLDAINQAVNRGESLETIIRLIAQETQHLFNSFGTTLHLLSPDRRRLVMQNFSLPPALVERIEKLIGIPIPRIEHDLQAAHPYRQVLESGKSQVINDLENIQEFTAAYLSSVHLTAKMRTRLKQLVPAIIKLLGYQSVLVVPLIADG